MALAHRPKQPSQTRSGAPGAPEARPDMEWNPSEGWYNWYSPITTDGNLKFIQDRHNQESLHQWQHAFDEARCGVQFHDDGGLVHMTSKEKDVNIFYSIRGGTDYPRFVLRLVLAHPKYAVSMYAMFPAWSEQNFDGHRDRTHIPNPGLGPLNLPNNTQTFTFSTALKNVNFNKILVSKAQATGTGFQEQAKTWQIKWQSEPYPICFDFDTDTSNLTEVQRVAAANFRKLRKRDNNILVILQKAGGFSHNISFFTAMPNPTPPPFPRHDARFNPYSKELAPVRPAKIPDLKTTNAQHIERLHVKRTKGWPSGPAGSMIDDTLVPYDTHTQYLSGRHYEVARITGLVREAQCARERANTWFNASYVFNLTPVQTSQPNAMGARDFVIFLNVRPSFEVGDKDCTPPQPGTGVTIELTRRNVRPETGALAIQGGLPASVSQGRIAMPPAGMVPSHGRIQSLGSAGSRRDSISSQNVGAPAAAPATTTHARHRSSMSSAGIQPPDQSALVTHTMSAGTASRESSSGRRSRAMSPARNTDPEEIVWRGVIVPNPGRLRDYFDICVFVRINPSHIGFVTDDISGNFRFGAFNPPYSQSEQAVRFLVHGEPYYRIPANNWLKHIVLAHETKSLSSQGTGNRVQTLHTHKSLKANPLNAEQMEAVQRSLSIGNSINHRITLIHGPPGTGKSRVGLCVGFHSYIAKEPMLISSASNLVLDHFANGLLELLSPDFGGPLESVWGLFRLETEFDEDYRMITRNSEDYQVAGEREVDDVRADWRGNMDNQSLNDAEFAKIQEWITRRITTSRPLSLGDHIINRIENAKREGSQWTQDWAHSKEEFFRLWRFITLRCAAERAGVTMVDILGESADDRAFRHQEEIDLRESIPKRSTAAWRDLQDLYLSTARIILVTSSTAGRRTLKGFKAHRVWIEEAAQMPEEQTVNACIRSYPNMRKLILAGDPEQLLPVALSRDRNEFYKDQAESLMSRLVKSGVETVELLAQYRSDPDISYIYNSAYYGGRLRNDPSVYNRPDTNRFKTWMTDYGRSFNQTLKRRATMFINVTGSRVYRRKGGSSLMNPQMLQATHDVMMNMYQTLKPKKGSDKKLTFAIASFYNLELKFLKEWFYNVENLQGEIQIVSVDASQGHEFDYVVLSTCRTGGNTGLGYLTLPNRQNVALSRARCGQVIVSSTSIAH